jgi:hypothetical protein
MTSPAFTGTHQWVATARLSQYAPERFNLLVNQATGSLSDEPRELSLSGTEWIVSLKSAPLSSGSTAYAYEVDFTCVAGKLPHASEWGH